MLTVLVNFNNLCWMVSLLKSLMSFLSSRVLKLVLSMEFLLGFHFLLCSLFSVNLFVISIAALLTMGLAVGYGVVVQAESFVSLVIYSVPSSISCSFFSGIFKLITLSISFLKAVKFVFLV